MLVTEPENKNFSLNFPNKKPTISPTPIDIKDSEEN